MFTGSLLLQHGGAALAVPVVESSATTLFTTGSPNHVVTMPVGVVSGDLLLLIVVNGGSFNIATIAGWTKGGGDATPNYIFQWFWKTSDGSEGATVTWTNSSTGAIWAALRISGQNAAPIDTSAITNSAAASSTTVAAPNITTSVSNCLLIQFFSGFTSATTGTEDNGTTEVIDVNMNSSYNSIVSKKDIATAGAVGVTTCTFSSAKTYRGAISISIKP